MATSKGPGEAQLHDGKLTLADSICGFQQGAVGSSLRIAIVHARWNSTIINALVEGAAKSLHAAGVKRENIVVQDVPGSYELPYAVQKLYDASKIQATKAPATTSAVADLLLSTSLTDLATSQPTAASQQDQSKAPESPEPLYCPFDAIVAIGVLIKGETMHFEYIAQAASQGLMTVQIESGVPVIFGLLTVLNEDQGHERAGLRPGSHCHGEDWGRAAVELGVKRRAWETGELP